MTDAGFMGLQGSLSDTGQCLNANLIVTSIQVKRHYRLFTSLTFQHQSNTGVKHLLQDASFCFITLRGWCCVVAVMSLGNLLIN